MDFSTSLDGSGNYKTSQSGSYRTIEVGAFFCPHSAMIVIYTVPISLYCSKVRVVLRHKRLEWSERQPPGGYGSDDYKKIVASGNLPTLVDGNLQVADSEAIVEYLEEKYPIPAILPNEKELRAKARELSRFHDTRLEPEVRKLFGCLPIDKRDTQLNDIQEKEINRRLFQLSLMLELSPKNLFLGHCGYPITFVWLDLLIPLLSLKIDWPEEIISWRKNIEKFTAVSAELSDYRPKVKTWINSL